MSSPLRTGRPRLLPDAAARVSLVLVLALTQLAGCGRGTSPEPDPAPEVLPCAPAPAPTPEVSGAASAQSTSTPFDVPAPAAGERMVFAHYFPPYPISLDNEDPALDYYARHYLEPTGEDGKFAAAGGLLRDRPVGRPPLPPGCDYVLADLRTDVTQAAGAGINGFTLNVMSGERRNWEVTEKLMTAADETAGSFVVVPNLDANGSIAEAPPREVAARLDVLLDHPSAFRLPDGRHLLSSFRAEGRPAAWWTEVFDHLASEHQHEVAFVAVLVDASPANFEAYTPISYALSDWGSRDPETIEGREDFARRAHDLGVRWMSSVAFQDVRPTGYSYAESRGSETLRLSWGEAIDDGADMVQLVTWNDYSEGTSFAVSEAHGRNILDLNAWYLTRFRTGAYPVVRQDAVYLVHRVQPVDAEPTLRHRVMEPRLGNSQTVPQDAVEVLTFLTEASELRIQVGATTTTVQAPAGVSHRTVGLEEGQASAAVWRGGSVVASVTSPYLISREQDNQDLQYYVAGSSG